MDVMTLPGLTDYHEAWELQRRVHAQVVAGERPDTLIVVEHPDVYTAGRRTRRDERPDDGTPVVDVDRGGKITWHGPGQQVVYPILRLAEPVDVVAYVRALEEAVMRVCAGFGLATIRVDGRTGVWFAADDDLRERKVCAIGVRTAKGVTMHGLALNCCPDLSRFERIVPCGITDADVTSLTIETGRRVAPGDVARPLVDALEDCLDPLRVHPDVALAAARRDVAEVTSTL
ncbi:lipoyl(octanoyl) transferase LipB [Isoptericola hypogeus]|uniref:Octanoyltransferase n=1 Tax=Isoptericola hypogeus TaxID=300179 RepID=A0ABN2JUA0_9MICO